MDQMQFNVLKRAQDATKIKDSLSAFFSQKGVNIHQVQQNPKCYEDLIMEYSRKCINEELFEESREHMAKEFNRLCEFHRRYEEELVQKFFTITKDSFNSEVNEHNNKIL